MLESLTALLTVSILLLASLGVGHWLLVWLHPAGVSRFEHCVWSVCTGLVCFGLVLMALGLAGLLSVPLIGAITLAGGLSGILAGLSLANQAPGDVTGEAEPPRMPWRLDRVVVVMALVAAIASLVSALAPPTAGDAMCYHLQLPKEFLRTGAIVYSPYDENGTFPLLTEMWFLWALAIDGDIAAQLMAWVVGVLFALATVVLATPLLGSQGGRAAGAVALLSPGVTNQMAAPLNDLALALFVTLGVVAWRHALFENRDWRWSVLGGAMWGAALGVKYTALLAIAAVASLTVVHVVRAEERRRLVSSIALAAVVAALVGGAWYMRAAVYRGNPVYPYFAEYFGDESFETLPEGKARLGRSPLAFVSAPWALTMHPEKFGGRGVQFGGAFLICLPGLLTARRLRGLRLLGVFAFFYFCVWFAMRQNLRFLLPIAPVLATALVWALYEFRWMPKAPRIMAYSIAMGALLVGALAPCARAARHAAVAVGVETRDAYLLREEPTYPAAMVLEISSVEQPRVLSQDYRAFRLHGEIVRENVYRKRTRYDRQVGQPGDLAKVLAADGFTHVLLAESQSNEGIAFDDTLARLVDAELAAGRGAAWRKLIDYQFNDRDGAVRRYRLFEITQAASAD